jgi:2Fe-2S ferredoxin
MARITYIAYDGGETILDVEPGRSVMQAAVAEGVLGIIGDCSGNMACATCHVYVDDDWVDRVGGKSDTESLMLEEVFNQQPNSRLSCQIKVSGELDGLVVRLPERQV